MSAAENHPVTAEMLAKLFHKNYERLAPFYNYRTREESAVPWSKLPHENRALMIATCRAVLEALSDQSGGTT